MKRKRREEINGFLKRSSSYLKIIEFNGRLGSMPFDARRHGCIISSRLGYVHSCSVYTKKHPTRLDPPPLLRHNNERNPVNSIRFNPWSSFSSSSLPPCTYILYLVLPVSRPWVKAPSSASTQQQHNNNLRKVISAFNQVCLLLIYPLFLSLSLLLYVSHESRMIIIIIKSEEGCEGSSKRRGFKFPRRR